MDMVFIHHLLRLTSDLWQSSCIRPSKCWDHRPEMLRLDFFFYVYGCLGCTCRSEVSIFACFSSLFFDIGSLIKPGVSDLSRLAGQ